MEKDYFQIYFDNKEPKKLTETRYDFFKLIGTGKLVILYKNKYVPVRNMRRDNNTHYLLLDNDEGTLLHFYDWYNNLYVFNHES